jgi:hypothetical protein
LRSHNNPARNIATLAEIADELTRQKRPTTRGIYIYALVDDSGVRHPAAGEHLTAATAIDAHFAEGDQPCQAFCRGDDNPHDYYCPICDGLRAFCANCHRDHHEAGWDTCKPGAYAEGDDV